MSEKRKLVFKTREELSEFEVGLSTDDSADRLVKRDTAEVTAADDDKSSDGYKPSGEWTTKPSVKDQLLKHPSSVRRKARVTKQIDTGNTEQLAWWNALQEKLHPEEAPAIAILSYECNFSPASGSYFILVTFCELEYQILV